MPVPSSVAAVGKWALEDPPRGHGLSLRDQVWLNPVESRYYLERPTRTRHLCWGKHLLLLQTKPALFALKDFSVWASWDQFARSRIGHFKGTRFQRGPKGGSSPWILSHSNFRSSPLILSLEGWGFEFYFCPTWGLVPILFSDVSPPFNLGPAYTFDWIGRNNNLDWWSWWNPLQNWRQTVRCMKFILLNVAAIFIKFTVTYFPTLKSYCFWTFRSRYVKILNLTQTKRLPNPVLLLFLDSCFDQAGRSLEEKPKRNKIYVPNLDRWTPLQNWHQPQVHIFFLGNVWHVYQLSHHGNGNHVNTISSWNPFFVDIYWNWSKKHAAKSWIPTSHPVHFQLRDSCLDLEGW